MNGEVKINLVVGFMSRMMDRKIHWPAFLMLYRIQKDYLYSVCFVLRLIDK